VSAPVIARLARDALVIVGIVAAVGVWCLLTFTGLSSPVDVHAYWVADPANLYPNLVLARDGYYYPPPFELLVGWGRLVPFDVFVALWRALLLAALVYLAGPFTIFILFLSPVTSEINAGNVQILLAAAVVLGFRWPATWAFVLLTKVSPGVGLLWFVVRREWRSLGIALGTTAALAAVSLLFWADQWPGYLRLVTSGAAPAVSPFYLSLYQRLPFAIVLVVVGAWRGWRWTVPVAATLALPVFYYTSLSMLVGVLPFIREWLGKELCRRGWWPAPEPAHAAIELDPG
jgi:Glycosyltransferase family 87